MLRGNVESGASGYVSGMDSVVAWQLDILIAQVATDWSIKTSCGYDTTTMFVFVHAQGIKTVHAGGGDQKMAKLCPRSCWMTPIIKRPIGSDIACPEYKYANEFQVETPDQQFKSNKTRQLR